MGRHKKEQMDAKERAVEEKLAILRYIRKQQDEEKARIRRAKEEGALEATLDAIRTCKELRDMALTRKYKSVMLRGLESQMGQPFGFMFSTDLKLIIAKQLGDTAVDAPSADVPEENTLMRAEWDDFDTWLTETTHGLEPKQCCWTCNFCRLTDGMLLYLYQLIVELDDRRAQKQTTEAVYNLLLRTRNMVQWHVREECMDLLEPGYCGTCEMLSHCV